MPKPIICPLTDDMDLTQFESGKESVDDYLKSNALKEQHEGITKVYVLIISKRIIGYIAIICSHYFFKLPDQDIEMRIPGLFIGQLGIDKKYQGHNLGEQLIQYCISLAIRVIGINVACRIIYLESLDDKMDYYKKINFEFIQQRKPDRNIMYFDLLPHL